MKFILSLAGAAILGAVLIIAGIYLPRAPISSVPVQVNQQVATDKVVAEVKKQVDERLKPIADQAAAAQAKADTAQAAADEAKANAADLAKRVNALDDLNKRLTANEESVEKISTQVQEAQKATQHLTEEDKEMKTFFTAAVAAALLGLPISAVRADGATPTPTPTKWMDTIASECPNVEGITIDVVKQLSDKKLQELLAECKKFAKRDTAGGAEDDREVVEAPEQEPTQLAAGGYDQKSYKPNGSRETSELTQIRAFLRKYDGPLWAPDSGWTVGRKFKDKVAPPTAVPCKPPGYDHIVLCDPKQ